MTIYARPRYWLAKTCLLFFVIVFSFLSARAQSILKKPVSVNLTQTKLADVLNEISKMGGFYFSYNGRLLPKDSLVNIQAEQKPVGELLAQLFKGRYELEEQGHYIIITLALKRLSLVNSDMAAEDNSVSVSGIVIDERTGDRLMNASVYEKHQLVSTLTDDHGYFKLKVKGSATGQIAITAGKLFYKDTTLTFLNPVNISERANNYAYKNTVNKGNRVETTSFGRMLISARQKIQSLNIPDFFATRPFQVSLTPGLSSHGMFSPQVVNKFSLNIIGGYTAGVNGLELGGLFNINKQDTRYVQVAGIFNLVGGNVYGAQIAGVHNFAIDSVKGMQIAGFTNRSAGQVLGLQLTTLHNDARLLKGVQIGLVNEADTSHGASIGLINIIGNGFYKISLTANNLMNTNLALKTGTHAFYSVLLTGTNISVNQKMYAFGLGIGHDFMFSNKFYASGEVGYQFANTGLWDDRWQQAKLLLNFQLAKYISIIAGPTYNRYRHSGSWRLDGYENVTNVPEYPEPAASPYQTKKWLGWEAGLAFNSSFKRSATGVTDDAHNWSVGLAATAGLGWDKPYTVAYGGEIFTQRQLGNGLSAVLSTGYNYFSAEKNYVFYRSVSSSTYSTEVIATPYRIIPVKVGIRSKLGGHFYIGGDLGESWAKKDDGFYEINGEVRRHITGELQTIKSFVFSATTGYDFGNGLDAGFKFEDYTGFAQIKQFALRLGYSIKLGK